MSQYQPDIKLIASDFHRNGVGGAGFTVSIFEDVDPATDDWSKGRRFLAIQFEDTICPQCHGDGDFGWTSVYDKDGTVLSEYGVVDAICDKCGGHGEIHPGDTTRTAVLDLDEANKGNIFMYADTDEDGNHVKGTGNNAWRGADYYGKQIAVAVRDEQEAYWARAHKRWDKENKKRKEAE